ncbi:helix-turn-helix domain-containing protein [Paenibacillus thermotolerans]|uniref:helix-turn-helix domain-containing protein n=1 Tax=Paenibacillus thermotolerans TaxID=3027807 RepID=UPI002367B339|nr:MULTISPECIES: AraC family transcriptional regulator [unclassified Paenibacillus]
MDEQLDFLLNSADLNVVEFDIHRRKEMKTFGRTLPYHVMSYHKEGHAKLRVGNETLSIEPGTVVYIPAHLEHDHYKDSQEETVFLRWHFTYEIAGVMDVMKMFQIPYTFKLQDKEHFEEVFLQFKQSTSTSGFLPRSVLKQAKALELLYILLDNALSQKQEEPDKLSSKTFVGILARIIQQPENPVSLQGLAEGMHMHPTYICNRFKELFGKSPMQMQREMRIQRAKALLQSGMLSVTEISNALGFSEIQNFSRLFKSYVGVSPKQYRDLQKKWRDNG